jgi:hypothetical protein
MTLIRSCDSGGPGPPLNFALKCKHPENEAKMQFTYLLGTFKLHLKGLRKIINKTSSRPTFMTFI